MKSHVVPKSALARERVNRELAQPTVPAHYCPKVPTKVLADASSYWLGAVLLQKVEEWRPVAYASRSMTITEKNYAQIKNEALTVMRCCDKFACYILGRHLREETMDKIHTRHQGIER